MEKSPIVLHGGRDGVEVFGYEDTGVLKLFEIGRDFSSVRKTSITDETLQKTLRILEDDVGYVTEFVDEELDGKQLRPSVPHNPNASHVGRFAFRQSSEEIRTMVRIHTKLDHDGNWPIVLHFPPKSDGIAV